MKRAVRWAYRGAIILAAPQAIGYSVRGPHAKGVVRDWLTGACVIAGVMLVHWAEADHDCPA